MLNVKEDAFIHFSQNLIYNLPGEIFPRRCTL